MQRVRYTKAREKERSESHVLDWNTRAVGAGSLTKHRTPNPNGVHLIWRFGVAGRETAGDVIEDKKSGVRGLLSEAPATEMYNFASIL